MNLVPCLMLLIALLQAHFFDNKWNALNFGISNAIARRNADAVKQSLLILDQQDISNARFASSLKRFMVASVKRGMFPVVDSLVHVAINHSCSFKSLCDGFQDSIQFLTKGGRHDQVHSLLLHAKELNATKRELAELLEVCFEEASMGELTVTISFLVQECGHLNLGSMYTKHALNFGIVGAAKVGSVAVLQFVLRLLDTDDFADVQFGIVRGLVEAAGHGHENVLSAMLQCISDFNVVEEMMGGAVERGIVAAKANGHYSCVQHLVAIKLLLQFQGKEYNEIACAF